MNSRDTLESKIVFITFRIKQIDSLIEKYEVKKINTIESNGKLKLYDEEKITSYDPYKLYYQILKRNERKEEFNQIENPLTKIVEYPVNDNKLFKKLIRNDSGEFVIRFQYHKDIEKIKIYIASIQRNKKLKLIYIANI